MVTFYAVTEKERTVSHNVNRHLTPRLDPFTGDPNKNQFDMEVASYAHESIDAIKGSMRARLNRPTETTAITTDLQALPGSVVATQSCREKKAIIERKMDGKGMSSHF